MLGYACFMADKATFRILPFFTLQHPHRVPRIWGGNMLQVFEYMLFHYVKFELSRVVLYFGFIFAHARNVRFKELFSKSTSQSRFTTNQYQHNFTNTENTRSTCYTTRHSCLFNLFPFTNHTTIGWPARKGSSISTSSRSWTDACSKVAVPRSLLRRV